MGAAAPKRPVYWAIIIVGAAYAAALRASGVQLDASWSRVLSYAPSIAAVALAVWGAWLWHLPGMRLMTARPRLHGLWQGTLQPTDKSHIPEGGNRGPIAIFLVVTQRYWSIRVEQFTKESYSKSRSYFWERCTDDDVESLGFIYDNAPRRAHQHRSPKHMGSCMMRVPTRQPKLLEGIYFTDRYTQGDMSLTLVDRTTEYSSFDEIDSHVRSVG